MDVQDHERVGFNKSQNTSTDVHIIDVDKLPAETAQGTDHHQIGFSQVEASLKSGTKVDFKEALQVLQDHNAVYLTDGDNRTVLHLVALRGDLDHLRTLAQELGDMLINLVNAQDKDGRTPLMLAVLAGKKDIVAHLCRKQPPCAEEIQPNIEDNLHKTALDHAKERNERSMVMELMQREDIQHYEEEQHRDMQLWSENVNKIGTYSAVIAALMFASDRLYVAPMNSKVAIWSSVCFSFALCGVFAGIMNIVAAPRPKQHNVKATIFYHHCMFTIACSMFSISAASLIAALVLAAALDGHNTNNPTATSLKAPISLGLSILPVGFTVLACALSRISAIRKFGKRLHSAQLE